MRNAIFAALALLAIATGVASAQTRNCTTTCFGNMCTTTCY